MKTNLSKLGWIIALMALMPTTGFAQTEANKTNERLEKIEQQLSEQQTAISQQQATISSLRSEIEAVTKQNLALKKNLNLAPTVAKAKSENLEVRVVEVTGNPATKDVTLLLMVENTGPSDKTWRILRPEVIDENESGYNDYGRVEAYLGDAERNSAGDASETNYHPGAPYKVRMVIKGFNPASQYIKYLNYTMRHNISDSDMKFENLPIKWVADE